LTATPLTNLRLFQSCAILGGILMPHSLYLGSGFVQHRMRDFDVASGTLHEARASNTKYAITLYRPTISAIKSCMKYSIAEMCISIFVITLFVNSAILIVAANSLGADAANADLPAIYHLFVQTIGQASGTYIPQPFPLCIFPQAAKHIPDAHQEPSSPSPSSSPASPPG
jgi:metal iron transporter